MWTALSRPSAARRAYNVAWRKAHPAEKGAYDQAWRAGHTGEIKAYDKSYYARHQEERKAYSRAYAAKLTPAKRRAQRMRTAYGMSPEDLEAFMAINGGRCCWPGCSRPATDVDHNHETREIRRPLCGQHNRLEGVFAKNSHELANWERYKRLPPFRRMKTKEAR